MKNKTNIKNNKGENEMKSYRVVDFLTNQDAERNIGHVFAECEIDSDTVDWYEKDYGIVITCKCQENKSEKFESLIGGIHGVTF